MTDFLQILSKKKKIGIYKFNGLWVDIANNTDLNNVDSFLKKYV